MKLNEAKVNAAETQIVCRLMFSGTIPQDQLFTEFKGRPAHCHEALRRLIERREVFAVVSGDLVLLSLRKDEEAERERVLYNPPF